MIFQVISSLKSKALRIFFYYQICFIIIMLHFVPYFVLATATENENLIS